MANEIVLYGSVGGSWWEEDYFTAAGVRTDLAGRTGPLTVRLNSGGGIASEGQAIYTMLSDYPDTVTIIVDGVAASAASLIAMAGDEIVMRMGAWMLIHDPAQPWTDARGTEDDHLHLANQLAVISRAYAEIYATRAGITIEAAREIMRVETIYDGRDAVDAGFATTYDGAQQAAAAARFDYRMYAHAPAALRDGSIALGVSPGKAAVMAMIAGETSKGKGVPVMSKDLMTQDPAAAALAAAVIPAAVLAPAPVMAADPAQAKPVNATIAERTRMRRILDGVAAAGLPPEFASPFIDDGSSTDVVMDAIIAKKKENDVDTHTPARAAATIQRDGRDKFMAGATLALSMKAGLMGERNEFSSMSMSELARETLVMNGERTPFSDKRDMIGRAFTMAGAHGTSDFGSILANIMGKAALQGWEESDETYPLWTRKGVLTDFKATKRVGTGVFAALPTVAEGENYSYGTIGDRGENITLATYGKMLRITRQAIINDDLSLLGSLPLKMGRAAKRTIGNLVYAILTGSPVMSDGVALFNATHGNLAGTAAAPAVTSLAAGRTAMRVQSDQGSALNIAPKYFIAPAALEVAVSQLLQSAYDPSANKGMVSNPVAGMAELIVDARLDAASATSWYLAADPSTYDTIEVAFLDGNDTPYLEQMNSWSADGVEMKVRIDAAAVPLDWRTLYKNVGV